MKTKNILIIFFIFSALYFCYVIFNDQGYIKVKKLQSERAEALNKNKELESEIRDLSRKVERLRSDPEYLEYIIRNEFNLVKEDEIVIYFKGDNIEKPAK